MLNLTFSLIFVIQFFKLSLYLLRFPNFDMIYVELLDHVTQKKTYHLIILFFFFIFYNVPFHYSHIILSVNVISILTKTYTH